MLDIHDVSRPRWEHWTTSITTPSICPNDYQRNIAQIQDANAKSQMTPRSISRTLVSPIPSLAPAGPFSTLYVLAPVGHLGKGIDWTCETGPLRAHLLRRLEEHGIRDIERRIRYERIITPDDWANDLQVYRGATFNLSHNIGQMLLWRPHNRFEDLDGMYLVGGGTHPGSGLPVIFESARISTRLMAEDLDIDLESRAGETAPDAAEGEWPQETAA